jgi:hypothetical protein
MEDNEININIESISKWLKKIKPWDLAFYITSVFIVSFILTTVFLEVQKIKTTEIMDRVAAAVEAKEQHLGKIAQLQAEKKIIKGQLSRLRKEMVSKIEELESVKTELLDAVNYKNLLFKISEKEKIIKEQQREIDRMSIIISTDLKNKIKKKSNKIKKRRRWR